MAMVKVKCDWCGKEFQKIRHHVRDHNFCCTEHANLWNGERLAQYNREENPMNKKGGMAEVRLKRSEQLSGIGEGKAYPKYLGRHAHRVIAEILIGRPLKPKETVHHIDGDKLNNDPENIAVFPSQSEHCKAHGFGTVINGNMYRKERKGDDDADRNNAGQSGTI